MPCVSISSVFSCNKVWLESAQLSCSLSACTWGLKWLGRCSRSISVSALIVFTFCELKLCSEVTLKKTVVFSLVLHLSVLLLWNGGWLGLECCTVSSNVYILLHCCISEVVFRPFHTESSHFSPTSLAHSCWGLHGSSMASVSVPVYSTAVQCTCDGERWGWLCA